MDYIYYKVPVAFFENEKYKDLSSAEMCMYSVLYARYELFLFGKVLEYTRKDKGIFREMRTYQMIEAGGGKAKDGIFIFYPVSELAKYVRISKQTVINGLKHLEEYGLIVRKKGRQGQPDKIYIHETETSDKKEVLS